MQVEKWKSFEWDNKVGKKLKTHGLLLLTIRIEHYKKHDMM